MKKFSIAKPPTKNSDNNSNNNNNDIAASTTVKDFESPKEEYHNNNNTNINKSTTISEDEEDLRQWKSINIDASIETADSFIFGDLRLRKTQDEEDDGDEEDIKQQRQRPLHSKPTLHYSSSLRPLTSSITTTATTSTYSTAIPYEEDEAIKEELIKQHNLIKNNDNNTTTTLIEEETHEEVVKQEEEEETSNDFVNNNSFQQSKHFNSISKDGRDRFRLNLCTFTYASSILDGFKRNIPQLISIHDLSLNILDQERYASYKVIEDEENKSVFSSYTSLEEEKNKKQEVTKVLEQQQQQDKKKRELSKQVEDLFEKYFSEDIPHDIEELLESEEISSITSYCLYMLEYYSSVPYIFREHSKLILILRAIVFFSNYSSTSRDVKLQQAKISFINYCLADIKRVQILFCKFIDLSKEKHDKVQFLSSKCLLQFIRFYYRHTNYRNEPFLMKSTLLQIAESIHFLVEELLKKNLESFIQIHYYHILISILFEHYIENDTSAVRSIIKSPKSMINSNNDNEKGKISGDDNNNDEFSLTSSSSLNTTNNNNNDYFIKDEEEEMKEIVNEEQQINNEIYDEIDRKVHEEVKSLLRFCNQTSVYMKCLSLLNNYVQNQQSINFNFTFLNIETDVFKFISSMISEETLIIKASSDLLLSHCKILTNRQKDLIVYALFSHNIICLNSSLEQENIHKQSINCLCNWIERDDHVKNLLNYYIKKTFENIEQFTKTHTTTTTLTTATTKNRNSKTYNNNNYNINNYNDNNNTLIMEEDLEDLKEEEHLIIMEEELTPTTISSTTKLDEEKINVEEMPWLTDEELEEKMKSVINLTHLNRKLFSEHFDNIKQLLNL
ncbi:hypothetical protein ABK040_000792 [Willaertia magna]